MSKNQNLKEIFMPTVQKVILALVVAGFGHLFLVVADLRSTGEDLDLVREFWVTNLINALPYLETDNTALKFITFFTLSYLIVWGFSKFFTAFDNVQQLATKKLRKHS
ncbi:hypothetical protein EXS54_00325 [Patescibacteria group bacterium]|nr:hypothetical protein [Patescibacteria group bacterium]